ncbi:MAG: hypothetical protein ACO1NU_14920 [Arcticibacter sp.]
MKVRRPLFFLLLLAASARAQYVNTGSRMVSMGNAGAAMQDVWSLQSNPAGIAGLLRPEVALTYQKNFPGTSLSTQAAAVVLPLQSNVFGLGLQRFGFSAYQESRLGFVFSRRFGDALYTALGFNYHQLSIPGYGNTSAFSIDAGLQYRLTKALRVGASISNLSGSGYEESASESIPLEVSVGGAYQFSDELLCTASLGAGNDSSGSDFRIGMEYNVLSCLALRAGLGMHPFNQNAGLGYKMEHVHVDIAISNHFVLGYTPQISLSYAF